MKLKGNMPLPIRRKESVDKYRYSNLKKMRAWVVLEYHVKKGDIYKPSKCEVCGEKKVEHGHHFDYSKPFEVTWVCALCHKKLHNRKEYSYAFS